MKKNIELKAVIPVAGLGTRMLPATKAIPKEMLPMPDRPLIEYVINECAQAGINEVILVTHSSKSAVEDHFDTSFELETILEKRIKRKLLMEVQSICPENVSIFSVRQRQALGLGHAIACAHPIIRQHPFAVLLPDVLLSDSTNNLKQMVEAYKDTGTSQILVEPVPKSLVSNYGVVDINGEPLQAGETKTLTHIVEKPSQEVAPSNLAVVGRYVFSTTIWPLIKNTSIGVGGEIQLTDAIANLIDHETVNAFHIEGKSYDCGNRLGYAKAFVEHAISHPEFGDEFLEYLKGMK